MIKNIIREVPPGMHDFNSYFDDDGLTSESGDYNNNLFIVSWERFNGRKFGFNIEEYNNIASRISDLNEDFLYVKEGVYNTDGSKVTYKQIMNEYGIPYSPKKCHDLKELLESGDTDDTETIAEFLTITTGKPWETCAVRGYLQGDYCEVVYCKERYDNPKAYGEIYLGCGKEFCVIDLDDDGNEEESCYGYIVADCEAQEAEEYKKIVCEWACIDEAETQIELIDGCYTETHYNYKIAYGGI